MDELDLLLSDLDNEVETVSGTASSSEELDPDVLVALEEFQGGQNPRDKVEALKLLLRLVNR